MLPAKPERYSRKEYEAMVTARVRNVQERKKDLGLPKAIDLR